MEKYKFKIDEYGYKRWYWEGWKHRWNDLPAVILSDGSEFWYRDGFRHREGNKPAIMWINGKEEYWENGKMVDK